MITINTAALRITLYSRQSVWEVGKVSCRKSTIHTGTLDSVVLVYLLRLFLSTISLQYYYYVSHNIVPSGVPKFGSEFGCGRSVAIFRLSG